MLAGRSERLAAIVAFTVFVRVRMTVRGNGFGLKHRTADGTLHSRLRPRERRQSRDSFCLLACMSLSASEATPVGILFGL